MSIKTEVSKLRNNIKTVSDNLKAHGFNVPNETMQGLIEATSLAKYNIITTITNGTYTGDSEITQGKTAIVVVTANEGYELPDTITVTGANYEYNASNGVINLSNPTDNVTITIECISVYSITTTVTNGTYTGDINIIAGGTATVTITPNSGYILPDTITVTGANYTYDKSTGVIILSNAMSDITINVECTVSKKWYEYDDWWNYCSAAITDDIGREVPLMVNGVEHKIRLIDIDHDQLADDSGKAHCTFQFAELLSDSSGNSLAIVNNDVASTSGSNYDLINSSLNKALGNTSTSSAPILWARKGQTTFDADLKGKTVLDMLPTSLVSAFKSVTKVTATTSSYTLTNHTCKLFALSYREYTATGTSQYAKEEGTTYTYWKNHDSAADRVIKDVANRGGGTVYTTTVELAKGQGQLYDGNTITNRAGYNYKADETGGGYEWLRSPDTYDTYHAWYVNNDGSLSYSGVYYNARGVAPAFCI